VKAVSSLSFGLLPVMKTNATSFPDAVDPAAFRSESLSVEEILVPSCLALDVIASKG